MNHWLKLSIEYANQRSYLDDLFRVYPTIPDGIRDMDNELWGQVEQAYTQKDNISLLEHLLTFEHFPLKDSYVAYLKRDKKSIQRNPATVARLCGRLYEMKIKEIYNRCAEPKETNRQIGPFFRNWVRNKSLGITPVKRETFLAMKENAILEGSDGEMLTFAREYLNYKRDKGLDLVCRFNGQYVIGEAKFLTDYGGHQATQFDDAITTLKTKGVKAITVAILDGILYIKSNQKMHRLITKKLRNYNIMSSLVLREFLYQL